MNIYISRDEQQYGPFAAESLPEMLRGGNVLPTDLLYAEGQSDWVLVSDYLQRQGPVAGATTPPPVPTFARPPAGGLRLANSAGCNGAPGAAPGLPPAIPNAGNAAGDLEREILAGGRYVLYQYCISILVMSFKRPSRIVFLRRDQDGFSDALSFSLISLAAGWWGIPWGPIWTISTVVHNARGGTDVTHAVLADKLGVGRATQIMARRTSPPSAGTGMKVFRAALIAVGLVIGLLVCIFVFVGFIASKRNGN